MTDVSDFKESTEALSSLLKAAGNSEGAVKAAENIGRTAITLTDAINNALLPLAAVNFAFDKARKYFNEKFSADIAEILKEHEPENLIQPDPSLVGPALQGLAFSHENADLRKMYLNLISNSMDSSRAEDAHPAFVDVLRQITPFEAQLVGQILQGGLLPVARIVAVDEDAKIGNIPKYLTPVRQHLLKVIDDETYEISNDKRLELMIDNFHRLGLISVDYEIALADADEYDWALSHPDYVNLWESNNEGVLKNNDGTLTLVLALQYGSIDVTVFGRKFAETLELK